MSDCDRCALPSLAFTWRPGGPDSLLYSDSERAKSQEQRGRMVGAEAGRGWEQVDAGRRTQAFSYKTNELRRLMYSMRSVVNNLY